MRLRFLAPAVTERRHGPAGWDISEYQARRSILQALTVGTLIVVGLFFCLLLQSYFVAGHTYVATRLAVNAAVVGYVAGIYLLIRRDCLRAAALLLVGCYVMVAGLAVWVWGINIPHAILILCMTIPLAGVLLGPRYSLYVAGLVICLIVGTQVLVMMGLHVYDETWRSRGAHLADALGYAFLFTILALVSWLFGSQVERSFRQARQAQDALLAEKRLLATRLTERTEALRAVQLKEMQQLHRFAQLGQLSTALLHDLSNRLTVLTLDIEDLQANSRHTEAVANAKQSIAYLDGLVSDVSRQLRQSGDTTSFDCTDSLCGVIANLNHKAIKADVRVGLTCHGEAADPMLTADATRFGQFMTILVSNAIDAAAAPRVAASSRRVDIDVRTSGAAVVIRVRDWGAGITRQQRAKLFTPFYTTKPDGMGIGLFIARQMVESAFQGKVNLSKGRAPTTFKVVLPKR